MPEIAYFHFFAAVNIRFGTIVRVITVIVFSSLLC